MAKRRENASVRPVNTIVLRANQEPLRELLEPSPQQACKRT